MSEPTSPFTDPVRSPAGDAPTPSTGPPTPFGGSPYGGAPYAGPAFGAEPGPDQAAAYGPPATLRRARVLLLVMGILGVGAVVLGTAALAALDPSQTAYAIGYNLVPLALAVAYLVLAGPVRAGRRGAIIAATVMAAVGIVVRLGSLSSDVPSMAVGALIGIGLLIWLIVSLNTAEARQYVAARRAGGR